MTTQTQESTKTKKKAKGPIRFEAIVPVAVITAAAYGYFSYFFDRNLRQGFEYVGTIANGAEVNVANVRTSFLRGTFDLDGLEVTDKDQPARNLVSLKNIHFGFLWDALLRMKFVVTEASVTDIQLYAPRKKPGLVLPPKPASPSKMEALQEEVLAQVKQNYAQNVLGDLIALLEGADPKDQLETIREALASEKRALAMAAEVKAKQEFWQTELKKLSDTGNVKRLEKELQELKSEKNLVKQAQGIKELNEELKKVQKQYKDIQSASKKLEDEVRAVAAFPKELEGLVRGDIDSLKDRFKIPKLDVKDMAMALFAKELGGHILQARKYQALAQQYLPEKKEREEIVPPRRSEGQTYEFPITTSYPLFWLKKAAISSKGTDSSYSGNVAGELTDVTTSPKWVKKPTVLKLTGDFPAQKVLGVKALLSADFTKEIPQQLLELRVNSFPVAGREFASSDKLKFGITGATGSTSLTGKMQKDQLDLTWNGTIESPQWQVSAKSKLAEEMLSGIVAGIPVVQINAKVAGPWKKLNLSLNSNLGDELAQGLKAQVDKKIKEAEGKLKELVDERIKGPQRELVAALSGNGDLVSSFKNSEKLFKDNEARLKAELDKLTKGGGKGGLEEQGKKLLKGLKLKP